MPTPSLTDWRERQYISQYSSEVLGLLVHKAGALADADGLVTALFSRDTDDTILFESRPASSSSTGTYEVQLSSGETSVPDNYSLRFDYAIDGTPQYYVLGLVIGPANPAYDQLPPPMKELIESVWVRFADLYDSPYGGPNLATYFQTHYSRGRLAQLLRIALGRLNTMAQPHSSFSVDDPGQFPIAQWGSLLETTLYIETLKHLIRSYVEQPAFVGGSVTRMDRRDYLDRWQSVLRDEEGMLRSQLDVFKISNMGLGKPKVLVGGGVYGRFGPTRIAGSVAARPRYYGRFY